MQGKNGIVPCQRIVQQYKNSKLLGTLEPLLNHTKQIIIWASETKQCEKINKDWITMLLSHYNMLLTKHEAFYLKI